MLLEQEWAKTHSCLLSQVIPARAPRSESRADWRSSTTHSRERDGYFPRRNNKQERFVPCGGVESVADATRRRRGNPASRILFQVCYRDEDVAGDNIDN